MWKSLPNIRQNYHKDFEKYKNFIKFAQKFKKAKEQLEKNSEIAQNLGYDDIRLLEYKKNKEEKDVEEFKIEQEQLSEIYDIEPQKEIEE